jgi:hypothetical protein
MKLFLSTAEKIAGNKRGELSVIANNLSGINETLLYVD